MYASFQPIHLPGHMSRFTLVKHSMSLNWVSVKILQFVDWQLDNVFTRKFNSQSLFCSMPYFWSSRKVIASLFHDTTYPKECM